MRRGKWVFPIMLMAFCLDCTTGQAQVNIGNYTSIPPEVSKAYAPNVLLLVSNDHTSFFQGYAGKRPSGHVILQFFHYLIYSPGKIDRSRAA